jgi:two-component system, response regulator
MMSESKVILLVEDNPDDVELARQALKELGKEEKLVVARDGDEALRFVFGNDRGNGATIPSLILLDLKLPGMNGLEVLQHLRTDERTRLVPVVILTSSEEEVDVVEGYRLGCNSYLRKPSNFGEFIKSIGALTNYWLELNQAPPVPQT